MKKPLNVLVFPGGTEIGLEIWKALSPCKEVLLFSAGLDISNHAPYVFARHFLLPSIHDPSWIDRLNDLIDTHQIDYIFPAYDDIIVALAQNAHCIRARIVTSPLETCLITRSKSQTYRLFEGLLPVPRLYEEPETIRTFPVFLKPDKGQGSQGTFIIRSAAQLAGLWQGGGEQILVDYLPGQEVTVDCFSDREAGLLFCSGRSRIRTKSGISMNSRPLADPVFEQYGQLISQKLALHGAWFFQLKKNAQDVYTLMEIAPRIAGTMATHRVLGINFPLLSLYEQERVPIQIRLNAVDVELDRALINRYRYPLSYRTVYMDLDDTLILRDSVNLDLIRFVYQCINKGIRLVLLTKHAADLDVTLKKHRLVGLFDEIIHLAAGDHKTDFIHEKDAIFVDDSFSERKAVSELHGIPTFDGSMIEGLMDERI